MTRDAFGVNKSHTHRIILRQVRDNAISATYDRSKKKRVSKSAPRYGMIKNLPGKRRILRIEGDTVHFEEEGVASRVVHRSRVTFLKDKPMPRPQWTQGTLFKSDVSKIAMQPIYHGTTSSAAKAIMGGKWNPKNKYVPGEPRKLIFTASQENKPVAHAFGVMRTGRSKKAGAGVIRDRDPRPEKARVLTYNAVGVKPVSVNHMERVYHADEPGPPVASHKIPSRQKMIDTDRATERATGIPSNRTAMERDGGSIVDATRSAMSMPTHMPEYAQRGLARRNSKAYSRWKKARNKNVHKSAFLDN